MAREKKHFNLRLKEFKVTLKIYLLFVDIKSLKSKSFFNTYVLEKKGRK